MHDMHCIFNDLPKGARSFCTLGRGGGWESSGCSIGHAQVCRVGSRGRGPPTPRRCQVVKPGLARGRVLLDSNFLQRLPSIQCSDYMR